MGGNTWNRIQERFIKSNTAKYLLQETLNRDTSKCTSVMHIANPKRINRHPKSKKKTTLFCFALFHTNMSSFIFPHVFIYMREMT